MESTTYLLRDEQGHPHAIFSGDTLFLGDVGLIWRKSDLTMGTWRDIVRSLRHKIMTLPDDPLPTPPRRRVGMART